MVLCWILVRCLVPFLFNHAESDRNQVVQLDQTSHEEPPKALDGMVWILLTESYHEVALAAVAVHNGEKHRHLVLGLGIHQATGEIAGCIKEQ